MNNISLPPSLSPPPLHLNLPIFLFLVGAILSRLSSFLVFLGWRFLSLSSSES